MRNPIFYLPCAALMVIVLASLAMATSPDATPGAVALGIVGVIFAASGIFSLCFASFIRTGMGGEE